MIEFLFGAGIFIGLIFFNPRDLVELCLSSKENEITPEKPFQCEWDSFGGTEQAH